MDWDDLEHIAHLEREIRVLESRLQPTGTGHLHTAINVLRDRINELSAPLTSSGDDGIDL